MIRIEPTFEEFVRRAEGGQLVPIHAELLADTVTPITAYLALVGDGAGYLLESVEGGEKVGRYSFIGLDPWKTVITNGSDPLAAIEAELKGFTCRHDAALPRFLGGAVGYIGYDCVRYFEPKLFAGIEAQPQPGTGLPEAAFHVGGTLVVFDHIRRRVILIVHARRDDADPRVAYEKAVAAIHDLAAKLQRPVPAAALGSAPPQEARDEIRSNFSREGFLDAVRKAKEYIAAGDAFQIVLSQRFERTATAEPFTVYRSLRAVNPSPYMYYLRFPASSEAGTPDFSIVGSSPEVMVRLEDGRITLRPIAGTRKRGQTEEEDRQLEQELLADAKECAEHIMLVDLGRNDVGRVAEAGSVRVDELMVIERYSHVMHIVSNVTGELRKGLTAYDVIRAAFPAGTVSGAPKIRAMEIIAGLEPQRRGPYAGAVGYVGFDGNSDTAIVLRTILVSEGRASIQAGAGLVYDSDPAREFEETENKAKAMMRALDWAEAGL